MRIDKRARAMSNYNGHKGTATVEHVERNVLSAYPMAQAELTGIQYGKVMSVANTSYQDGVHSQAIDTWGYDGIYDFLAGLGRVIPDGNGGYRSPGIITVDNDTITIEDTVTGVKRQYKQVI